MNFTSKNRHYELLRKKWLAKNKEVSEKLVTNHGEVLRKMAIGGLGGLMLLTTPAGGFSSVSNNITQSDKIQSAEDKNAYLAKALSEKVPSEMRRLSVSEENEIEKTLDEFLGVNVKAELNGIRLNRSYGMIGGEQHLYRYPGDNLYNHADNVSEYAMFIPSGIAPRLGAWGYFAPSKAQFDDVAKMKEKYYLAVQTFLVPGYAENVKKYSDFFKHRKMLVVNPKSGQCVVAVIGDAGPAEWTGKHLGGSPEVMHYLGLAEGSRKGAVLYFFLDDPENKVPLGPITPKGGEA